MRKKGTYLLRTAVCKVGNPRSRFHIISTYTHFQQSVTRYWQKSFKRAFIMCMFQVYVFNYYTVSKTETVGSWIRIHFYAVVYITRKPKPNWGIMDPT